MYLHQPLQNAQRPPRHALSALFVIALIAGPSAARAENNPYLEAIGALGTAQLYTSYTYIGVTADAFAKQVYKAKQVRQMMGELDEMLNRVDGYLEKVGASKIAPSDKAYVDRMRQVIALLGAQSRALVTFAGSGGDKDAANFEASRKAAWTVLKEILGISDKPAPAPAPAQ